MNRTDITEELMHRFFEHQTTSEENDALAAWAKTSPENQKKLDRELRVYAAVQMVAAEALAAKEDEDAAAALLELSRIRRKESRRNFFRKIGGIAAAIVLSAGVTFLTIRGGESKGEWVTAKTLNGQRVTMVLEDGTTVELNSGTTLRYPARFGRKERRVAVEGEALFNVKKNQSAPFIVETYAYDIRVTGTEFNVVAESDNDIFTTALLEGGVSILDKASHSVSTSMLPGDIVMKHGNSLVKNRMANPEEAKQWTEGIIPVSGIPFEELMKRFERTFGVRIVIDRSPAPENAYSTGKLRISDGLEHALKMLSLGDPFEYGYDENTDTYHIK